ncbi:molecular chaperone HtpG [Segnochrobactraceae bacterium EtOH-i3]
MSTDSIEKPAGETRAFEADVSRLLHLMVHSVYSSRDVFLRELVSNAADACEKLRTLALTDESLLSGDPVFRIRIDADKDAGTLAISDTGIGMSREELVANLGTIARSGTRAFLEALENREAGSALIGQFGVGFYSAFMVADSVTVISRRAGSDAAWAWTSDGSGSYTIAPVDPAEAPARGTRVLLTLKDDAKDFAEAETIERVVRQYAAHVPVPIDLAVSGEEPRQLVDGSALWLKSKSDVTPEEYREFYGLVSGGWDEPALTLHYRAEGRQEYSVLAFVPSMKPFDLFDPDRKGRVKLYVRRMFITDDANLLPSWLRFVRGVVDSEDLPLNLSREMLQSNPLIEAINKGLTGRLLTELGKLAENDAEAYLKIWENFGPVMKEGLYEAPDRRDALFNLARFRTTAGDGWRSLKDVLEAFRDNQTAFYFLTGDTLDTLKAAPQLEGFRARRVEVLLLADPVDAFWVQTALGYEGKPFKSVTQGAADLELIARVDDEASAPEAPPAELAALVTALKEKLGAAVSDVRASGRLAESPVCLVAPDFGPDRQFERLMSRGRPGAGAGSAPILELNPRHALIRALGEKAVAGNADVLDDAAVLLLGQARILDGEAPTDPAGFAKSLSRLMAGALSVG